MRARPAVLLLLLAAACDEEAFEVDPAWFASRRWDDGKAEVLVYEGRYQRYGKWRAAKVTDYLIREYLDPRELTKRDREDAALLPVLKVNRHLTFTTGTYEYRLMHSLFFHRRTGRLVKAVGTSQEGCGVAFQRWDSGKLRYDTYWEGEGAGARDLPKRGHRFFADELPFLGARLPHGRPIDVYPSLTRNSLRGWTPFARKVVRQERRCLLQDETGQTRAEFVYDGDGFLERWTIAGAQEFRRVARTRLYYWHFTDPGDESRLQREDRE
ncbi:MAG: hypothetical protein ACYTEZ_06980 [Planctomycetota bacterium]|jgi:hypothetical protein